MPVPYEEPANVVLQTQVDSPVTSYGLALADRLEALFAAGVHELDEILEALNAEGPKPVGAERWTEELFESEMTRLGAKRY